MLDDEETIEGAPGFKEEHLPCFDCAFKAKKGVRIAISYQAHIRMMAAVQHVPVRGHQQDDQYA